MVEFTTPRRDQLARIAGDDEALIRVLEEVFRIAGIGIPAAIAENAADIATNADDITRLLKTKYVIVTTPDDLPPAVSGVITLAADTTYFIVGNIDLTGDRLETAGTCAIIGVSSEVSSIKSTGLGASTPLLTSRYTIPVRFITFRDVGTALYIDDDGGANAPLAIDWYGVNFNNVTTVGEVGTVDNFVFDTGAFLDAQGLSFTGTIGTAAFSNSLFSGDGSAANIIEVSATATFTRRFRIIYSSVVASSSTVGLNVSTSASIPVEGYILDTVNFSGGGTYTSGVAFDDNKARWDNNRGIDNSAAISNYYMNGNVTATTIGATGTPVKVAGTTTSAAISQKFTNTDNRATYKGAIQRDFKVTAVFSVESGNNNEIGAYIAKNGTVIASSEIYVTTNAGGRAEAGVCQTIVDLDQDDYIEVFVENNTSTSNVTATELNVIVEAIN